MADFSGFTQSNDFVNSIKHMDKVAKSWSNIISSNFNDVDSQSLNDASVYNLVDIYNNVTLAPAGILTGEPSDDKCIAVGRQIAGEDAGLLSEEQAYYLGSHVNSYINQNKPFINNIYSVLSKCSIQDFNDAIRSVDSNLSYYSGVVPALKESLIEIVNAMPSGSINYDRAFRTINFDLIPYLHKLQHKNILTADIASKFVNSYSPSLKLLGSAYYLGTSDSLVGGEEPKKKTKIDEKIQQIYQLQKDFNKVYGDKYTQIIKIINSDDVINVFKEQKNVKLIDTFLKAIKRILITDLKNTPIKISGINEEKDLSSSYILACQNAIKVIEKLKLDVLNALVEPINSIIDLIKSTVEKAREIDSNYISSSKSSIDYIINTADPERIKNLDCYISKKDYVSLNDSMNKLALLAANTKIIKSGTNTKDLLNDYIDQLKNRDEVIEKHFNNFIENINNMIQSKNIIVSQNKKPVDQIKKIVSIIINKNKESYKWLNSTIDKFLVSDRIKQIDEIIMDSEKLDKITNAYVNYQKFIQINIKRIYERFESFNKDKQNILDYNRCHRLAKETLENLNIVGYLEKLYSILGIFDIQSDEWASFKQELINYLANSLIWVGCYKYDTKTRTFSLIKNNEKNDYEFELNIVNKNKNRKELKLLNKIISFNDSNIFGDIYVDKSGNPMHDFDKHTKITSNDLTEYGAALCETIELKNVNYIIGFSLQNLSSFDPIGLNGNNGFYKWVMKSLYVPIIEQIDKYIKQRGEGDYKQLTIGVATLMGGSKMTGANVFDIIDSTSLSKPKIIPEAIEFYVVAYGIIKFYFKMLEEQRKSGKQNVYVKFSEHSPLNILRDSNYNDEEIKLANISISSNSMYNYIRLLNNYWNAQKDTNKAIQSIVSEFNNIIVFDSISDIYNLQVSEKDLIDLDNIKNNVGTMKNIFDDYIEKIKEYVNANSIKYDKLFVEQFKKIKSEFNAAPTEDLKLGVIKRWISKIDNPQNEEISDRKLFVDMCITPLKIIELLWYKQLESLVTLATNADVNGHKRLLYSCLLKYGVDKCTTLKNVLYNICEDFKLIMEDILNNYVNYIKFTDDQLKIIKEKILTKCEKTVEELKKAINATPDVDLTNYAKLLTIPVCEIPNFFVSFNDGFVAFKALSSGHGSVQLDDKYFNQFKTYSFTKFVCNVLSAIREDYYLPCKFYDLIADSQLRNNTFSIIKTVPNKLLVILSPMENATDKNGDQSLKTVRYNGEIIDLSTSLLLAISTSQLAHNCDPTLASPSYINKLCSVVPLLIAFLSDIKNNITTIKQYKIKAFQCTNAMDIHESREIKIDAKSELEILINILSQVYAEYVPYVKNIPFLSKLSLGENQKHYISELRYMIENNNMTFAEFIKNAEMFEWIMPVSKIQIPNIQLSDYDRFSKYRAFFGNKVLDEDLFNDSFNKVMQQIAKSIYYNIMNSIEYYQPESSMVMLGGTDDDGVSLDNKIDVLKKIYEESKKDTPDKGKLNKYFEQFKQLENDKSILNYANEWQQKLFNIIDIGIINEMGQNRIDMLYNDGKYKLFSDIIMENKNVKLDEYNRFWSNVVNKQNSEKLAIFDNKNNVIFMNEITDTIKNKIIFATNKIYQGQTINAQYVAKLFKRSDFVEKLRKIPDINRCINLSKRIKIIDNKIVIDDYYDILLDDNTFNIIKTGGYINLYEEYSKFKYKIDTLKNSNQIKKEITNAISNSLIFGMKTLGKQLLKNYIITKDKTDDPKKEITIKENKNPEDIINDYLKNDNIDINNVVVDIVNHALNYSYTLQDLIKPENADVLSIYVVLMQEMINRISWWGYREAVEIKMLIYYKMYQLALYKMFYGFKALASNKSKDPEVPKAPEVVNGSNLSKLLESAGVEPINKLNYYISLSDIIVKTINSIIGTNYNTTSINIYMANRFITHGTIYKFDEIKNQPKLFLENANKDKNEQKDRDENKDKFIYAYLKFISNITSIAINTNYKLIGGFELTKTEQSIKKPKEITFEEFSKIINKANKENHGEQPITELTIKSLIDVFKKFDTPENEKQREKIINILSGLLETTTIKNQIINELSNKFADSSKTVDEKIQKCNDDIAGLAKELQQLGLDLQIYVPLYNAEVKVNNIINMLDYERKNVKKIDENNKLDLNNSIFKKWYKQIIFTINEVIKSLTYNQFEYENLNIEYQKMYVSLSIKLVYLMDVCLYENAYSEIRNKYKDAREPYDKHEITVESLTITDNKDLSDEKLETILKDKLQLFIKRDDTKDSEFDKTLNILLKKNFNDLYAIFEQSIGSLTKTKNEYCKEYIKKFNNKLLNIENQIEHEEDKKTKQIYTMLKELLKQFIKNYFENDMNPVFDVNNNNSLYKFIAGHIILKNAIENKLTKIIELLNKDGVIDTDDIKSIKECLIEINNSINETNKEEEKKEENVESELPINNEKKEEEEKKEETGDGAVVKEITTALGGGKCDAVKMMLDEFNLNTNDNKVKDAINKLGIDSLIFLNEYIRLYQWAESTGNLDLLHRFITFISIGNSSSCKSINNMVIDTELYKNKWLFVLAKNIVKSFAGFFTEILLDDMLNVYNKLLKYQNEIADYIIDKTSSIDITISVNGITYDLTNKLIDLKKTYKELKSLFIDDVKIDRLDAYCYGMKIMNIDSNLSRDVSNLKSYCYNFRKYILEAKTDTTPKSICDKLEEDYGKNKLFQYLKNYAYVVDQNDNNIYFSALSGNAPNINEINKYSIFIKYLSQLNYFNQKTADKWTSFAEPRNKNSVLNYIANAIVNIINNKNFNEKKYDNVFDILVNTCSGERSYESDYIKVYYFMSNGFLNRYIKDCNNKLPIPEDIPMPKIKSKNTTDLVNKIKDIFNDKLDGANVMFGGDLLASDNDDILNKYIGEDESIELLIPSKSINLYELIIYNYANLFMNLKPYYDRMVYVEIIYNNIMFDYYNKEIMNKLDESDLTKKDTFKVLYELIDIDNVFNHKYITKDSSKNIDETIKKYIDIIKSYDESKNIYPEYDNNKDEYLSPTTLRKLFMIPKDKNVSLIKLIKDVSPNLLRMIFDIERLNISTTALFKIIKNLKYRYTDDEQYRYDEDSSYSDEPFDDEVEPVKQEQKEVKPKPKSNTRPKEVKQQEESTK